MKITKSQLRRLIREQMAAPAARRPNDRVAAQAARIFLDKFVLDETEDNTILVVPHDPEEAEDRYEEWIRVWPEGDVLHDGAIDTGIVSSS